MTREKKEILKKIEYLDRMKEIELEVGCGFFVDEIMDNFWKQEEPLFERLRILRHYDSIDSMFFDERGWDW